MHVSFRTLGTATAVALIVSPGFGQPPEPVAPPAVPRPASVADQKPSKASAEELGYVLGFWIGQQIIAEHKALATPLDQAALGRGLTDAVRELPPQLQDDVFRRVQAVLEQREREIAARLEVAARENLAKGRRFLEANAKRPGVTVMPSGLQYEVIKQGGGPTPTLESVVMAHYRGTRIDGSEFDGNDPQGEPTIFPLGGVVPGWQEALQKMAVGAKWRIWLPPELAYGEGGSPPAIEPNEVLIFEIELVGIHPGSR